MSFPSSDLANEKNSREWNDWIMKTISGGSVSVKVNGEVGPFFRIHQDLRQGRSTLSSFFYLAVDVLSILVGRAVEHGLISLQKITKKGILPYCNMQMIQYYS